MLVGLSEQVLFSPAKSFIASSSFSEYSVPSLSFANILKRSVHLVSAADSDINQVGKESSLIIAKISFFSCFQISRGIPKLVKYVIAFIKFVQIYSISSFSCCNFLALVFTPLYSHWFVSFVTSLKNMFGTDCAALLIYTSQFPFNNVTIMNLNWSFIFARWPLTTKCRWKA